MTKVFISIPWFIPAFRAGGPIQSIANLVSQPKQGYQFYIFCADTDLNGEALPIQVKDKWVTFNDHTMVYYAGSDSRSVKFKKEWLSLKPDVLMVVGIYSWHFNLLPLLYAGKTRSIISVRGMLHPGALSQKSLKKKWYLRFFKWMGLHRKCVFHATDEQEARFIKDAMGPQAKVLVAGNYPRVFVPVSSAVKKAGELSMTSLALISPMKNHALVLNALKKVTENVTYHIYGPVKDQAYWTDCLSIIAQLPGNIKVHIGGELPPDRVNQAWMEADVMIMPSKSENYGHSIIEALSAGLPVITSRHTPWNGLEIANAGINVDQTEDAIASAIRFFAQMDDHDMQVWRRGAAAFAASAIDLPSLHEQYAKLFYSSAGN